MPQVLADELRSIQMSPNLGESLERAHRFAREQAHRFVMLEHLLLALTEDPEASLILQSANVDLSRLATDVSGYLGRLLDDMRSDGSVEPKPDPELLRVLQAAASAAQQSKRRQIDGSIVLAAIVGDGKSPAAGLLKTHGMTFEQAIRALQLANTKARLKPIAKASKPAPVEPLPPPRAPEPEFVPVPDVRPPEPQPLPEPVAPAPQAAVPVEEEPRPRRAGPTVQTADDILAAARARIQRRAAQLTLPPDAALEDLHALPSPQDDVSDAMRELLAASPARPAPEPAPAPSPARNGSHSPLAANMGGPDLSPAPEPPRPRLVPAPDPRAEALSPQLSAPYPAEGMRNGAVPSPPQMHPPMHQGPRADPPPPWNGAPAPRAMPQQAGPALRQGAGPGGGPGGPPQPVTMDPRRVRRATAPLAPYPAQPAARKQRPAEERSPVVETIPKRMRIGATSMAEVSIPRERIDSLVHAIAGRGGADPSEPVMTRALTVRLRSPSGDFFVEPVSSETLWVEQTPHAVDAEPLVWSWHITPRQAGREKLVLLVSMRSMGPAGASEEAGLPDRVIDVKVRGRPFRAVMRGILWIGLLALAVMLGRVGGELGPMLLKTVRQLVGV
ncbi:MAG: hypothetical protein EKK41_23640 [Hyphomicrobiales bacterium]|nr:MAG: hypothetical protein EKK41_23640 [Hyphomicrobiales bacterium]